MPDYRIQTDVYNGPMDLLLYLIRRNEVDLYDIPIALITTQYCEYVATLSIIDPNAAGDFLVMAAALMEMKSRMLLPRTAGLEGEPEDLSDPRLELVRQLLEYKKFKDASFELGAAAAAQALRWPRAPFHLGVNDPAEVDLENVQVWDLVAAFTKLMASIGGGRGAHEVVFDDTPVALHAADILDRLQGEGGEMHFEQVFVGRSRAEMIGLFLALLELMRQQRVRITQAKILGPITILLLSAEPIQIGEEAGGPELREAVLGSADSANEPAGRADAVQNETGDGAPAGGLQDDEAQEAALAGFEELDRIKTDVDLDSVLREEPAPREGEPKTDEDSDGSE